MAKENVAKFYEKLVEDATLAEKLNDLDKAFAAKNEGVADDIAMREQAATAIVIPLAKEVGLPFTLEELKEYEQEQLAGMALSDDELEQVAGGRIPGGGGCESSKNYAHGACAFLGIGVGLVKKKGKTIFCVIIGGSNGRVAG